MCESKPSKTVEVKFEPFIQIKEAKINYNIPTYDEIVKEGTRLGVEAALETITDELLELLGSDNAKYLSIEDYNKIKELIMKDEFPCVYSACIYYRLAKLLDRYEGDPIYEEYEKFMYSMYDWAYEMRF